MKTLSLEFLEQNNACKEGIMFVKNNNLLNFPFELLNEIKGDHNGYIKWLKECIDGGYEYDVDYYKDSNGIESWYEYDENNNLIHYKDSTGYEYWESYDKNSNLIHHKDSTGYEEWYEYDENNNLIYYKDSEGIEYWNRYDENNNLIHYKDSNGYEYDNEIEYYPDGQLKKYNELELPWFEKEDSIE